MSGNKDHHLLVNLLPLNYLWCCHKPLLISYRNLSNNYLKMLITCLLGEEIKSKSKVTVKP